MPNPMHNLASLHEEAPEGIGLRNAMNLGDKISKAMGLALFNTKKNLRTRKSRMGGLAQGPRVNTSPVPKKPRHRKFFGMDKPQIPY